MLLMVFPCMSEGDVHLEIEDAREWVYSTVMDSGGDGDEVLASIEEALNAVFEEAEEVTEEDIDETIEDDLSSLKEDYKEGEMSKDEYKRARSDAKKNREVVRQQLLNVDLRIGLKDGHAAGELLAGLLGNPSIAYEGLIEPTGDVVLDVGNAKFGRRAKKIGQEYGDRLRQLVPKALEVVKRLQEDEAMRVMGILMGEKGDYVRAWLDAYSRLERNLKASQ